MALCISLLVAAVNIQLLFSSAIFQLFLVSMTVICRRLDMKLCVCLGVFMPRLATFPTAPARYRTEGENRQQVAVMVFYFSVTHFTSHLTSLPDRESCSISDTPGASAL